jgi:WS/DGAT/MGAT family acyltransferase
MPNHWYERLSAMDSSFLALESQSTHMHVAATAVFEQGPLATPAGGVDIDRIRAYINARLHWIPRYRQRLAWVPVENEPVWIDDDRFNIDYHVRHTSLPRPGDEAQLKRLSSRIMSQQLDRGKPLWEIWIAEGLTNGRFALVSKTHHCMIDGVSGVDIMAILLGMSPEASVPEAPLYIPRPAPGQFALLRDELSRRARMPLNLARGVGYALREFEEARTQLETRVTALSQLIGGGFSSASDTPLNKPIGPHRRCEWLTLDLAEVKAIKNRLGGTVNDVVLTTVAGAVRRFLEARRVHCESLDFRAMVPVSVRSSEQRGALGNRVSGWITPLPIAERDPKARLLAVQQLTQNLKESKQALGAEMLAQVTEWTGSTLLSLAIRLSVRARPFNLIVTNVPGPQIPLYLLGARMLEAYPMVPLFMNQGLGIALFSYAGQLCWGFNADWDVVPHVGEFVKAVSQSFRELYDAARPVIVDAPEPVTAAPAAPPAPKRARRARRRVASSNGRGAHV